MGNGNEPDLRPRDEYGNLLDPQARAHEELPPADYARRARLVDYSMRLSGFPCLGGECDLDDPCRFHASVGMIAELMEDR